ncbi:hypothetical protein EON65_35510 [archaeon]|nr:MAG: hypothetical protein EON65_35510 [archaeon]
MQQQQQESKRTSLGGSSDDAKRDKILTIASNTGLNYGLASAAIAGGATLLAMAKSKRFNDLTTTSIRTSLPVMAGLGMWGFAYEGTAIDAQRHPEKYGIHDMVPLQHQQEPLKLPRYQRFMNYVYDHPFQLITALSIPFAGGILYTQMGQQHLTISQRIMHSRVFAQAGVLSILLTTMGFLEYMEKRGKFADPEEEIRKRGPQ